MRSQPDSNMSGAPIGRLDDEKTYYQGRMGVKPTANGSLAFRDSAEDGMRKLDMGAYVEPYSEINSHRPTPDERGVPTAQGSLGGGGVDLRFEKWNRGMK
jgi:hypothetical protein